MNGRWFCNKCSSWNEGEKSRCSFCSNPKPLIPSQQVPKQTEAEITEKLTQLLHNSIEKLTPFQKKKMYRYLEDNVL